MVILRQKEFLLSFHALYLAEVPSENKMGINLILLPILFKTLCFYQGRQVMQKNGNPKGGKYGFF